MSILREKQRDVNDEINLWDGFAYESERSNEDDEDRTLGSLERGKRRVGDEVSVGSGGVRWVKGKVPNN